jgi:acid phosphatase type 7
VPVARAHAVDAIIGGHDHVYERGETDGLTWFVSGGGGAPLVRARSGSGTRVARSLHHFLVVDVNGAGVDITARDDNGAAFDRVELAAVLR